MATFNEVYNSGASLTGKIKRFLKKVLSTSFSAGAEKAKKAVKKIFSEVMGAPIIENIYSNSWAEMSGGGVMYNIPVTTTADTSMMVLALSRGFWEWRWNGRPKYNGVEMILAGSQSPTYGEERVDIYYLLNPTPASGNVTIGTNSYTPYATVASVVCYKNTSGTPVVTSNQTKTVNITPTFAAGDLLHAVHTDVSSPVTAGAGQTEIDQINGSTISCALTSRKFHNGSSTSMSIVSSGAKVISIVAEISGGPVPIGITLTSAPIKFLKKIITHYSVNLAASLSFKRFFSGTATTSLSASANKLVKKASGIIISVSTFTGRHIEAFISSSLTATAYPVKSMKIILDQTGLSLAAKVSIGRFFSGGATTSLSASMVKFAKKVASAGAQLTSSITKAISSITQSTVTLGADVSAILIPGAVASAFGLAADKTKKFVGKIVTGSITLSSGSVKYIKKVITHDSINLAAEVFATLTLGVMASGLTLAVSKAVKFVGNVINAAFTPTASVAKKLTIGAKEATIGLSSGALGLISGLAEVTLSVTAEVAKFVGKTGSASTALTSNAVKYIKKVITHDSINLTASVIRGRVQNAQATLSASVTKVVKIGRQAVMTIGTAGQLVAIVIDSTLNLTAGISKFVKNILGAVTTLTGGTTKRVEKIIEASLSIAGNALGSGEYLLEALFNLTAGVTKFVKKIVGAVISMSSAKQKRIFKVLGASTTIIPTFGWRNHIGLALSINLSANADKFITKASRQATLTISLFSAGLVELIIDAGITITAETTKFVKKLIGASLILSAYITKRIVPNARLAALALTSGVTKFVKKIREAEMVISTVINNFWVGTVNVGVTLVADPIKNTLKQLGSSLTLGAFSMLGRVFGAVMNVTADVTKALKKILIPGSEIVDISQELKSAGTTARYNSQSFTPSVSKIKSISLAAKNFGYSDATVINWDIYLADENDHPTGSSLANKVWTWAELVGWKTTWDNINLDVTPGVKYCIRTRRDAPTNRPNYDYQNGGNVYPDGGWSLSVNGTTWSPVEGNDLKFEVTGESSMLSALVNKFITISPFITGISIGAGKAGKFISGLAEVGVTMTASSVKKIVKATRNLTITFSSGAGVLFDGIINVGITLGAGKAGKFISGLAEVGITMAADAIKFVKKYLYAVSFLPIVIDNYYYSEYKPTGSSYVSTIPYTCPSDADYMLVFASVSTNGAFDFGQTSYGGDSMSLAAQRSGGTVVSIWKLANPSTGLNNLSITWTPSGGAGGASLQVRIVPLKNVSDTGATANIEDFLSIDLTPQGPFGLVFDLWGSSRGTIGAGQTLIGNEGYLKTSYKQYSGTGQVTLYWAYQYLPVDGNHIALEVKGVGGYIGFSMLANTIKSITKNPIAPAISLASGKAGKFISGLAEVGINIGVTISKAIEGIAEVAITLIAGVNKGIEKTDKCFKAFLGPDELTRWYGVAEVAITTTAGKVKKFVKKLLETTFTLAGWKMFGRNLFAAITVTPTIQKFVKKILDEAEIIISTLDHKVIKIFITNGFSLAVDITKKVLVGSINATLVMSANVTKFIKYFIDATFTLSAKAIKLTKKLLEATLTLSAYVIKLIKKGFDGAIMYLTAFKNLFYWKDTDSDEGDDHASGDEGHGDDASSGSGELPG